MANISEKIQELKANGFVIFRNFVSPELVAEAHDQLKVWYDKDLEARKTNNISEAHYDGCSGHTILTEPSHLMLDVYGKSPMLDKIVDQILTDPHSSAVLKDMVGSNIDFYGYNVRLMTGTYDTAPAHEWHIDSPGEMGIGVLLTDTPADHHAATALIPGSHMFPYCPRWNTLFKNSCRFYKSLNKFQRILMDMLPFNGILKRRVAKIATGAHGKRGDIYYFINDTWHGREPNLEGRKTMVLLIGGSAPDMKLHHKINLPSEDVLSNLPESIKYALCERNKPQNPNEPTIIKEMLATREKLKFFSVFYFARLERKIFDVVNKLYQSRFIGMVKGGLISSQAILRAKLGSLRRKLKKNSV